MQHRRTLIASISCLFLASCIAQADITTFTPAVGNSGFWNDSDNWDNGIPTATDRAVIPAGKICTIKITTAIADTIDVQASGMDIGELIIDAGMKLTLENDTDNITLLAIADHSIVDGLVTLAGSNSVLEFTNHDHGVSGTGEINGQSSNARIEIEAGFKFTSRLATGGITGAMIIKGIPDDDGGTGTFRNDGLVKASIGGQTLELHADTVLEDHSTVGAATWTSGGGVRPILLFSRDASLKGDFSLVCDNNAGRIHINADIDTCGDWQFSAGFFKIFANKTFRYGSYSGIVTNPGTSISVGCLSWTKTGLYDVAAPSCP